MAKKTFILFLSISICFLSFSVVGSSLSSAATVYVDTDGTGDYNCDGTNDHIEINKALTYIDSLGGGTVYLRGPNTYWIDATLEMGSNTILTGDSSACIKLVPNAGWSAEVPLIKNKSGANRNFTIKGFEIDGNSESQSVSRGKGYYNLMYFENCKGVTVTDMHLEWGTGDGLKVKNKPYSYTTSADITFTGNTVYKLGHDALYVLGMNGVTVANNDVFTRTNSAFRLSSSGNAKIYNNVIHSALSGDSTGPGIEIDKSSGYKSENIEIYNNKFSTFYGSGIWIDGEDSDNVIRGKNVYIHHNTFTNVGGYPTNTGYSNAAITIGQFDNTKIEYNVIDNGGQAGIKYYQYSGSYKMSSKFTTYVNNNVIKNCNKNVATGVWNYNSANHKFVLTNNCIYNNAKGPYTGSNIEHTGDTYTSSSESATLSGSTVSNQVDNPPVANAGSDKTATPGSAVSFDGSASTDDKGIASYSWDFDASNGITSESTVKTATKTYTTAGTYTATLTVTDTSGQKATDTVNVVVSTTPVTNTQLDLEIYDNRLRESAPSTVYADSTYLDIGKSTSSCRDVMWFDLSEYSTTDTVSKATLSLYWYYPAGTTRTSDTVVEVYRPVEWDPKYVSWTNRASGTPWSTPGGNWYDKNGVTQGNTPYATLTFPAGTVPGNKYYEFDVTQLVQEYVSGKNKNTGLFLKAKTESGNYISFYSAEWSNAAQRPKLTVSTTTGSTTTGSTTVDDLPVANAGADKTATTGSAVSFDGSASTDDKGIASYSWDFDASNGIASEATGKTATKTYTTAGTYTVTLTVTDTNGQKSTDTVNVVVSGTTSTTTDTSTSTSGSVSYSATYDNRLRESLPTSILSDSTYLDMGKSTSACRDVMMFDLSGYKTTDTIKKATLSLYWYYPAGATRTSDTIVEIYRPVEWDPKYVNWNNRASGTPWSTAGGNWYDKNGVAQGSTPYASLTFPAGTVPGNKYYELDVTELVQKYISGENKNTGFFLKAKTESGNYIAFYSSDWSNAAQRPKLTVTS